jgi:hypothetical protein
VLRPANSGTSLILFALLATRGDATSPGGEGATQAARHHGPGRAELSDAEIAAVSIYAGE